MGWYTQGPGGVAYKYGDVTEALWYTDLGRVLYHPRIAATGDDDIEVLTFVEDIQKLAQKQKLPWSTLPFYTHDICSGIPYRPSEDDVLERISEHLVQNKDTLKRLLASEDNLHNVDTLVVSVE